MTQTSFHTETGFEFPGVSTTDTKRIRKALFEELGLTRPQVAEAASYSMAMVVRFALGLSANAASVCVLASDNLCGDVAVATARHLVNAGSKVTILVLDDGKPKSAYFDHQISILSNMGVAFKTLPLKLSKAEVPPPRRGVFKQS